jgi:hypothetical protein
LLHFDELTLKLQIKNLSRHLNWKFVDSNLMATFKHWLNSLLYHSEDPRESTFFAKFKDQLGHQGSLAPYCFKLIVQVSPVNFPAETQNATFDNILFDIDPEEAATLLFPIREETSNSNLQPLSERKDQETEKYVVPVDVGKDPVTTARKSEPLSVVEEVGNVSAEIGLDPTFQILDKPEISAGALSLESGNSAKDVEKPLCQDLPQPSIPVVESSPVSSIVPIGTNPGKKEYLIPEENHSNQKPKESQKEPEKTQTKKEIQKAKKPPTKTMGPLFLQMLAVLGGDKSLS